MARSISERRIVHPVGILIWSFSLLALSTSSIASDETIPPDGWIYDALRLFELRGLVNLAPYAPYPRSQVERYVERILVAAEGGIELSARQRFLLDRLRREFAGKSSLPEEREDGPLWLRRDGDRFAAIDIAVGAAVRKELDREKGQADGFLAPGVLIDVGGALTLETAYRVRIQPERDLYRPRQRPSPREKSFRGITSEFERGYCAAGGKNWRMQVGRDYLQWGGNRYEGLILSQTAGSLDHVAGSVTIGRFTLNAVHVLLDPALPRRLAGHRLVVELPRSVHVGISETVIYTGRSFDFTYLVPIASYYANQYGERGDDNVLWGLDVKAVLGGGIGLSGELMIDDYQYENDPPAPNRIAYNVTVEALVAPGGRDVEVTADYTFIDIFTYAHRDSLVTRYVSGDGDYPFNPLLGSPLGPDADRWRLRLEAAVHPRAVLGASASVTRRGEGNDLREWRRDEDPDPAFPSGSVTRERRYGASCTVDLGGGSSLAAGAGWSDLSRDDEERRDSYAFLELVVDF